MKVFCETLGQFARYWSDDWIFHWIIMCTCVQQITSLHLITIKLISGFSSLLHYFPQCINVPNYKVSSSQLYLTQESNHSPASLCPLIGQHPEYWPLIGWQVWPLSSYIHLVGVCPSLTRRPREWLLSSSLFLQLSKLTPWHFVHRQAIIFFLEFK